MIILRYLLAFIIFIDETNNISCGRYNKVCAKNNCIKNLNLRNYSKPFKLQRTFEK